MEYKALPTFTKAIEDRTVTGIFAVHGNIDSYGDISHPGSFSKTIAEGRSRIKYFWNHNLLGFPTAKVLDIREVTRMELPDKVLDLAPDATGGVEVTRKYLNTPDGNAALEGLREGAITEQSYGYDPVKFDFSEINGTQVRNLREVRLWEVSDVNFGANSATAAVKFFPSIDVLLKQIELYLEEIKAGRRNNMTDQQRIDQIALLAIELGATNAKLMDTAAPEEEPVSESSSDEEKSRAEPAQEEKSGDEEITAPPQVSLTLVRSRMWEFLREEAGELVT